MSKNVIEMVIFQTKENVNEEQFLHLFHELNHVLENDIEGFEKRSLTKDLSQNKWVEIIWWKSMDAAQTALKTLPQIAAFQQYCSALKDDGTMMFHLEEMA
ncbi:MAG: hypothetical protein K2M81_06735 [Lachnospiraceae bacterium]|nr:hypothetical protein [Lachnospiraceae bacterium]